MRLLLVAALLASNPALAQSSLWNAESRWEFISGDDDMGAYLAYLREYPDSPHVAEARARLTAFENTPPARLDTPACAATLQERAETMLASALSGPEWAEHDAVVPPGHFLADATLVSLPRGRSAEDTPIERQVVLRLVASPSGRCVLMQRWSHGSGLPEECRCSPVDPDFRFPSPLVDAVFADYLRFQALDRTCVARGAPELSASVDAFLAEAIARREARAVSIRARAASGQFVLPTELGEAEDIELALPVLKARQFPPALQFRQAGAVKHMSPEQLDGLCGERLEGLLAEARGQLLQILPLEP